MGQGNAKIIALRRVLAEKFPPAVGALGAERRIPVEVLERELPRGVPGGVVLECVCTGLSCGGTSLLQAWVVAAAREGWVALVDGADTFDAAAMPAGVGRLVWARCRKVEEAVKAADLLLRDGNFSWVLLDLRDNVEAELRRMPRAAWYRLQRLGEGTGVGLAVFTRSARVVSAGVRVEVGPGPGWESLGMERGEVLAGVEAKVWRRGKAVGVAS